MFYCDYYKINFLYTDDDLSPIDREERTFNYEDSITLFGSFRPEHFDPISEG